MSLNSTWVLPTPWICLPVTSGPPCHWKSSTHQMGWLWVANPIEIFMFPCRLALCLENSRLFQEFCFVDPNKNLILLQGIDIEVRMSESYRVRNTIKNCNIFLIITFNFNLWTKLNTEHRDEFHIFLICLCKYPRSSKALFRLSNQYWHLEDNMAI